MDAQSSHFKPFSPQTEMGQHLEKQSTEISSPYAQSQRATSSPRSNTPWDSVGVRQGHLQPLNQIITLTQQHLALLPGLVPPKWAGLLEGAGSRVGHKRL